MKRKFSKHNFLSIISICLLVLNLIVTTIFVKPLIDQILYQENIAIIIFGSLFFILTLTNLVVIAGLSMKFIFAISVGIIFWLIQAIGIVVNDWEFSITTGLSLFTEFGFKTGTGKMGINVNWFAVIAVIILLYLRSKTKDNNQMRPITEHSE